MANKVYHEMIVNLFLNHLNVIIQERTIGCVIVYRPNILCTPFCVQLILIMYLIVKGLKVHIIFIRNKIMHILYCISYTLRLIIFTWFMGHFNPSGRLYQGDVTKWQNHEAAQKIGMCKQRWELNSFRTFDHLLEGAFCYTKLVYVNCGTG